MAGVDKQKILVSVGGGEDSLVTCFILKKQGYDVHAVSFLMFSQEEKIETENGEEGVEIGRKTNLLKGCRSAPLEHIKSKLEAMDISFYASRAEDEFSDYVLDPFLTSRIEGTHFVPCYLCNYVKFSLLLEKSKEMRIDNIASGHYAKIHMNKTSGLYQVLRANDEENDQSNLLINLSQEMLSKLILPLGDMKRTEVTKLAGKFGLQSLKRDPEDDSKVIGSLGCFKDTNALKTVLDEYVDEKLCPEGSVINWQSESIMADHSGIKYFQVGQFNLEDVIPNITTEKSAGIVKISSKKREIYVGDVETFHKRKVFHLHNLSSLSMTDRSIPMKVYFKIFADENMYFGILYFKNNEGAVLVLEEEVIRFYPGRLVVIYNTKSTGSRVVGHGILGGHSNFSIIHRSEENEEIVTDDDGEEIPHVGKEFEF